ncbi:MAG: carboxylating nicotinate-nucleotide diphosphorylase [Calditrichia bacterium]|jgi:nicotinate-nucleotide pyrophosphorylase (carboxylating)|nr:carboxylating nicotinate-nucleotide diphosphorylase [Calditrichia bacterium]
MRKEDILEEFIRTALAEDIGQGDFTTLAIVDKDKNGQAQIIAKQNGILAGIEIVKKTFFPLDHDIQFETQFKDGDKIDVNDTVIIITGKILSILKGERTALNLLAHLSGISTLTAKYVEEVRGTQAKITDTRKTTPLLRDLEKEAVRAGGGINHRMGLYDMVLIKDNHIQAAGGIREAVNKCKQYLGENKLNLKIEVETTNLNQVRDALACDVDQIMLDNMALNMIREAVNIISGRAVVEASGGISLKSIRSIAETGVDLISIGALTHSAPVFDFSLLLEGA